MDDLESVDEALQPPARPLLDQVCVAPVAKRLLGRSRVHRDQGQLAGQSGKLVQHIVKMIEFDMLENVDAD